MDERRNQSPPDPTEEQRAWMRRSEALWKQAHDIAARHPQFDPSDIHHVLRNLELTPSERLNRGLNRVRVCSHSR